MGGVRGWGWSGGGLFHTCVAESAFASLGLGELGFFGPDNAAIAGHDHLAYAFAVAHGEGLVGEVDDDDSDFAAIVGINRAG